MNELNWHPDKDDPAYDAGVEFSRRHPPMPDGFMWAIRQAFWCGAKWQREQHTLPISGKVLEDGKIEWRDQP